MVYREAEGGVYMVLGGIPSKVERYPGGIPRVGITLLSAC